MERLELRDPAVRGRVVREGSLRDELRLAEAAERRDLVRVVSQTRSSVGNSSKALSNAREIDAQFNANEQNNNCTQR